VKSQPFRIEQWSVLGENTEEFQVDNISRRSFEWTQPMRPSDLGHMIAPSKLLRESVDPLVVQSVLTNKRP
jgi:hypothetical protein